MKPNVQSFNYFQTNLQDNESSIEKFQKKKDIHFQEISFNKKNTKIVLPKKLKDNVNEIYLIKCPFCLKSMENPIKKKEKLNLTEILKCNDCDEDFMYFHCISCTEPLYLLSDKISNYNLGINIKCPYNDCKTTFSYNKCGKCKRFLGIIGNFVEGTTIKCPYDDCLAYSITIICPFDYCDYINIFPDKQYFEGYKIKCNDKNCGENFAKFNCKSCLKRFYLNDNYEKKYIEGENIICPYENCGKIYNKFICPSCNRCNEFENSIFVENNSKNYNQIKCSYSDCNKYFSKIFCPKCFCVIENLGKNNLEGKQINCGNKDCNFEFSFYNCLHCKKFNIWESK